MTRPALRLAGVTDVAEALRLSPQAVRLQLANGRCPVKPLAWRGREALFSPDEVARAARLTAALAAERDTSVTP